LFSCFVCLAAAAAGTSSETGYVATFTVVGVGVEVATAIVVIFFTNNGNAVNRPAPGVFFARSVPSPRQFFHHFLSQIDTHTARKNHFEFNRGPKPNKTLLEMYINDFQFRIP
jgi:hypothetical protein